MFILIRCSDAYKQLSNIMLAVCSYAMMVKTASIWFVANLCYTLDISFMLANFLLGGSDVSVLLPSCDTESDVSS